MLSLAGTNPDRSQVWNRLIDFYQHCADADIPQLGRLAWTITIWQPSIIAGINTGISNGKTEGYNRIVNSITATPHSDGSMVGCVAFGFRNTENHKRRIRFACTRASRREPTRTAKSH
ncbi:hypothetical protein EH165_10705 [Nakamurella antarctica]|uniref:Transposase IS204/IS1001/IS1096/IS1165 DDE domain-containing protein n=1 Tax=Nakamurella antarctica TaxID=1902245 RepID=A0A3G8ZMH9_9ACTN|nr:transposase [Nakamurella antarctica]AZI58529.1 hypothetical protein EH165_10705 [Nakamurella antarctica]